MKKLNEEEKLTAQYLDAEEGLIKEIDDEYYAATDSTIDEMLAAKIYDTESIKIKGLTNSERSRIYYLLTGKTILFDDEISRPPEAVRDLKLAIQISKIKDAREQNTYLRKAINKYKTVSKKSNKPTSNIAAYKTKLLALLKKVEEYHPDDVEKALEMAGDRKIPFCDLEIYLHFYKLVRKDFAYLSEPHT